MKFCVSFYILDMNVRYDMAKWLGASTQFCMYIVPYPVKHDVI